MILTKFINSSKCCRVRILISFFKADTLALDIPIFLAVSVTELLSRNRCIGRRRIVFLRESL